MLMLKTRKVRSRVSRSMAFVTALLAVAGCASEVLTQEEADLLEAQGPYVEDTVDGEVQSTTQALSGVPAGTGYVWGSGATTTTPYVPFSNFSFNSAGRDNVITKLTASAGRYRIEMPGLFAPGNVQVMAYGNNTNRCNLRSEAINRNGAVRFEVACFTHDGMATDSQFVAFFNNTGDSTGKLAMASVGTTGLISNMAKVTRVDHLANGTYRVRLASTVGGGAPFVTARSTGANFCNPKSDTQLLEDVGGILVGTHVVEVRCFDLHGVTTNTSFQFTYMDQPSFSGGLITANARSTSINDSRPLGFYSNTSSDREVFFDHTPFVNMSVNFFTPGINSRSMSLVNAVSSEAVFCRSAWSTRSNASGFDVVTDVRCNDINGVKRGLSISNAIFGFQSLTP
jgi:hypothetical protein